MAGRAGKDKDDSGSQAETDNHSAASGSIYSDPSGSGSESGELSTAMLMKKFEAEHPGVRLSTVSRMLLFEDNALGLLTWELKAMANSGKLDKMFAFWRMYRAHEKEKMAA